MRASIGGISLMSIFIVFFIIIAFLLTGTVMYYKGYKVNSRIIHALEMYEGYNEYSAAEIDRVLTSYGYRQAGKTGICGKSSDGDAILCLGDDSKFEYKLTCSYDQKNHGSGYYKNRYISYKVTSYIYIDLPMNAGTIKIPVTTRTNPIYQFTYYENGIGCYGK